MATIVADSKRVSSLILYRIIPGLLVISLGTFVTIASLVGFFPETFGPIFSNFISLQEDGIYADCSLAQNRNNRICTGIRHDSANTREWNALQKSKKPMPFNLHGG